jgi:hypothetical protein
MKITVYLVIDDDDGHEETITDVVFLEKACQQIEQVGLTLAEAKSLLAALQQRIVERQAAAFVATRTHCQACGTPVLRKNSLLTLWTSHLSAATIGRDHNLRLRGMPSP